MNSTRVRLLETIVSFYRFFLRAAYQEMQSLVGRHRTVYSGDCYAILNRCIDSEIQIIWKPRVCEVNLQ